jgi:Domain of unknown function (DUF4826)
MDPADAIEEAWCSERRRQVEKYLRQQGLEHGEIGEAPAWFVAPILSIWAVESLKAPGFVGWWVICGDVPTDYCSAGEICDPKRALRHFASSWQLELDQTNPDDKTIGSTGLSRNLIPLLEARVKLMSEIAADLSF